MTTDGVDVACKLPPTPSEVRHVSVDVQQQIKTILREHAASTGNAQHLKRTDGISEVLLDGLVAFLVPFEKESKRLEGENYPTLAMAATSIRELLDHCAEKPGDSALRREAGSLLRDKAALDLTQMTASFFWPNTRRLRVLQQEDRDRVMANVRNLMREEEERDVAAGGAARVGGRDFVDPGKRQAAAATSPLRFGSNYMDVDEDDDEVDSYLSEKGIPYVADPLQWWRENGCKKYPKLWRIARRHLAIMASRAPSERVWSKTGLIITPRRSRIGADLVNAYILCIPSASPVPQHLAGQDGPQPVLRLAVLQDGSAPSAAAPRPCSRTAPQAGLRVDGDGDGSPARFCPRRAPLRKKDLLVACTLRTALVPTLVKNQRLLLKPSSFIWQPNRPPF
ncbi:E3 SUMO-protein ligase ZBED1 [Frankliniella fusca]|uniref:E3 SUMO-protein ligase ZBED1 n=1 Tax=Frankliniella fusca TaxID=407009 RepID=A0AAE1I7F2_9NEOP|nr:E3 SUMO-protein ligase ZBED1 [Frankliniella fusca]